MSEKSQLKILSEAARVGASAAKLHEIHRGKNAAAPEPWEEKMYTDLIAANYGAPPEPDPPPRGEHVKQMHPEPPLPVPESVDASATKKN